MFNKGVSCQSWDHSSFYRLDFSKTSIVFFSSAWLILWWLAVNLTASVGGETFYKACQFWSSSMTQFLESGTSWLCTQMTWLLWYIHKWNKSINYSHHIMYLQVRDIYKICTSYQWTCIDNLLYFTKAVSTMLLPEKDWVISPHVSHTHLISFFLFSLFGDHLFLLLYLINT